ncbi:MAG: hypothetical protein WKF96_05940, partial [Solirubrobacteraceae bacterium]
DRAENQSHVVVLHEITTHERVRALLQPYLDAQRKGPGAHGTIAPFTEETIDVILSRSEGKPRDVLRKAFSLVEQGATLNWHEITAPLAADVLDSLTTPDDDYLPPAGGARRPLEENW